MMRVIPNWEITYYEDDKIVNKFKIADDYYCNVITALNRINMGIKITEIRITREVSHSYTVADDIIGTNPASK